MAIENVNQLLFPAVPIPPFRFRHHLRIICEEAQEGSDKKDLDLRKKIKTK